KKIEERVEYIKAKALKGEVSLSKEEYNENENLNK
ncbi:unnamed protein product, partial [marine sediment metagenome]